MSVLKIDELLRFTNNQVKTGAKNIANTHRAQAQKGIDASGKQFPRYTAGYAARKAANKVDKKQISTQVNPVDLTLTGAMWKEWEVISTKLGDELEIKYGINDAVQGEKMHALRRGSFGKASSRGPIRRRRDKARPVALYQKLGPETELEIVMMFAKTIKKNLKRLTNRPTIIRM
tara:strand:- start:316 stop:840 length:525 start_codon:yes stop_codon:yes gene_type:complete